MAVYGDSYSEDKVKELINIKTNVGGYFFDAFLKIDHNSNLTITSHPVEEGANITDHAYVEAQEVTMEIGMSDVCTSYINGQFKDSYSRSVSAFDVIKKLQAERVPLTVHTRLNTYENMLIETITVPDDYTTLYGLRVTIGLKEIIVAKTNTVSLPARVSSKPQKTAETKKGTVNPVGSKSITSTSKSSGSANTSYSNNTSENKSTLKQGYDKLFGGKK